MGTFTSWFKVGAGTTLGAIGAVKGAEMTGRAIDKSIKEAYEKYRSENFDNVVRQDLSELLVLEKLSKKEKTFPDYKLEASKGFFKRHPIFTGLLIVYFINLLIIAIFNIKKGILNDAPNLFMLLLFVGGIYIIIRKLFRKGTGSIDYKKDLYEDGEQYWRIREYVREALELNELDPKDAILKISNTRLAQQFPDTADEIDANAFNFRKKLGL